MNLTPEEKEVGRDNYYEAVGAYDKVADPSRRDFLKKAIAAGAVSGVGLGAMYFRYDKPKNPVRVGVIGTGDEGNVLINAINPEYVQVVAISDIRPYNVHRAFHGDWSSPDVWELRRGLMAVYGWKTEDEARQHVKVYGAYQELLKDPNIEAVIIALPLHLHAPCACQAMKAGKHVLTEKLMAHNVAQCKVMGRLSHEQKVLLAVGHQRHYSVLYDNAVHLLRWGILGELHHIRAQWHRGNLPGRDSWQQALPGGEVTLSGKSKLDKIARELAKLEADLKSPLTSPKEAELLRKKIAQWRAWDQDKDVKAEDYGYESTKLSNGRPRPALEELCRWRLWDRTGGGLMAELGSHQLDAAGIFCSALRKDGKKAHPLTVHVVGGRQTFPQDRDCDDHVYCLFEFPAPGYDPKEFEVGYKDDAMKYPGGEIPGYDQDKQKKIVVMYSSINGNGFGGYGEVVMGTKGTLVLEREQQVMLYKSADTSSRVSVKDDKGGPTMNTQASGGAAGPVAKAAEGLGKVSRGYTEEIEHWAWCIRNPSPENEPHCKPEVALGDAVIALTTNFALKQSVTGKGNGFVKFDEKWYELDKDETPDGSDFAKEYARLVKDT